MKILKLMLFVTISIVSLRIYAYGQQDHWNATVYEVTDEETVFEIHSDESRYMNGQLYSVYGTSYDVDAEYILDMFDGEDGDYTNDVILNVRKAGERWR